MASVEGWTLAKGPAGSLIQACVTLKYDVPHAAGCSAQAFGAVPVGNLPALWSGLTVTGRGRKSGWPGRPDQ